MKFTVTVHDIREYTGNDGDYIGRGSPLGSPFVIGIHGDRDHVIDMYRTYFVEKLYVNDPMITKEISRLRQKLTYCDVDLLCHCAPRKCHGDIIANFLNCGQRLATEKEWKSINDKNDSLLTFDPCDDWSILRCFCKGDCSCHWRKYDI